MRRLPIVVVIAALSITLVPVASAHTLSQSKANARAKTEMIQFTRPGDVRAAFSCGKRISAHKWRCLIAAYDQSINRTCDAFVDISYASRGHRGSATKASAWFQKECYEGDRYELMQAGTARISKRSER